MSYQLTPEQQALSLARKKKKEEAAAITAQQPQGPSGTYEKLLKNPAAKVLIREWLFDLRERDESTTLVATWNILAQILVRRDLFVGSDCLRTSQRHPMILAEILSRGADIFCLQEVDRQDTLLPTFRKVGYTESFGCGPGKKHGCMILHRAKRYEKITERVVFYDQESVRSSQDGKANVFGLTHRTRNIGLLVALRDRTDKHVPPIIVATTHLFWHGLYKYERARQAGILKREAIRFRDEHGDSRSSIIMAGDFNFQPNEVGYALLRGVDLTPEHYLELESSRVVHVSLDPTVPRTPRTGTDADDDDEAAGSGAASRPDLKKGDGEEESEPVVATKIKDARIAVETDGLLTNEEMLELFGAGGKARSAYDGILEESSESTGEADNVISARDPSMKGRKGANEPMWSCFTHYWRSTLDYIFIIDPPEQENALKVLDALKSARTEVLGNGLPRLRISPSDHISLATLLGKTGSRV
ncbi:RNA exonuclease NGL2 [Rhizoctonia solani]|uniref:RNA exonuclease NGL2 n=1 Tax=Rhizoctonia solani TaxID=456999 RepID=A0A0K6FSF0_9AGAM|nr:RNA exonuclease NGL2 [Rhizoctonia solani]